MTQLPPTGTSSSPSRVGRPPSRACTPRRGVGREDLALALATDCLTACCAGMPPAPGPRRDLRRARWPGWPRGLGARGRRRPRRRASTPPSRPGRDRALAERPGAPVAVLLGDLPALRADDLGRPWRRRGEHPLAVVPDADGDGHGPAHRADRRTPCAPAFGDGSAARHEAAGHHRLDLDLPRLRTDVDDDRALRAALALGVGPGHRGACSRAAGYAAAHAGERAHLRRGRPAPGSALLDDGVEVPFTGEVFAAARCGTCGSVSASASTSATAPRVTRLWIVGIGDDQPIG